MSLSITKAGMLDTVQDLGRYGYSVWGVNPGGVMDPVAAQVANMLVGNEACAALIEIHFPGPQILFEQNALISICGADFQPTLNGELLPLWQPVVVRRNTVLQFAHMQKGSRTYLAVHGGLAVDKWLGSASTNLKAGMGGWQGRKLEKGDELSFNESSIYYAGFLPEEKDFQPLPWWTDVSHIYDYPNEVHILAGHEFDRLCESSRKDLLQDNFTIHPSSDRMGYQLKGTALELREPIELLSSGVSFGTLQLLPGGQLILLMADHQTTGGYPRIAHVISAHWPKLAQMRPSESMHFTLTDIGRAEAFLFSLQQELTILQRSCADRLNQLACTASI